MNTAQRIQSRAKHQVLPKFFRPKLNASQITTCRLIHWDAIALITSGKAGKQDMLDWMANAFTYGQMALLLVADGLELSDEAQALLAEQIDVIPSLVGRYRATGRVGFSGTELQIARAAAYVMDDMLELDRYGIADQAARWSVAQMQSIVISPARH